MKFTSRLALVIVGTVATVSWNPRANAAKTVTSFLEKHCSACHDAAEKKGGLDLEALQVKFDSEKDRAEWVKVFGRVLADEMPPPKKPRPDAAARRVLLETIGGGIVKVERARAFPQAEPHRV